MDSIESQIASRLRNRSEVLFALLFGSRASGSTVREDSDWDVGVYLDPALTSQERFRIRLDLIAKLAGVATVDLVVLNDAPALLGHRALQGRLLFARDRVAYVRYFVKTFGMSEDERHYRDVVRAGRERRLREGTFGRP